jgi:hypothetical protein
MVGVVLWLTAACGGGQPDATVDAEEDTAAEEGGAVESALQEREPSANVTVVEGFDTPESVLHDETADLYLVANINGNPTGKDNNGYISRVAPDGTLVQKRWIVGGRAAAILHAPKGMAIVGETLFVADIDSVRLFDRVNGEPVGAWTVAGATFLNDLASGPDGRLYVSDTGVRFTEEGIEDTGTAGIFRFDDAGAAEAVDVPGDVARVNGLFVDAAGIHAVTFGTGAVFSLSSAGDRLEHPGLPGGSLDGIVVLEDGSMLISDWETQAVYLLAGNGIATQVGGDVEAPADIGFDAKRGRVLVPSFTADKVILQPLQR